MRAGGASPRSPSTSTSTPRHIGARRRHTVMFRTDAVEPIRETIRIRDDTSNFVIHEEGILKNYKGKPFVL
jgi:hypothetical protein